MDNLPLHPILVHFPIALGLLAPVILLLVWLGIHKWNWPTRTWSLIPLIYIVLLATSLGAVKTGEIDEEKVEPYLTYGAIEEHEEMGEKIPWVFAALLVLSTTPFLFRSRKKLLMATTLVFSIASIAPIVVTGHTGGELVYKKGAANAHLPTQQQNTEQSNTEKADD